MRYTLRHASEVEAARETVDRSAPHEPELWPPVQQDQRAPGAGPGVVHHDRARWHPGEATLLVPAGTSHNVINVSTTTPLKLYTIYSPPNHPDGTVHKTKKEAEAAEASAHHS